MIRLTVTGIDEAIQRATLLERVYLIAVSQPLEWFGETTTAEMKEGHNPGEGHPERYEDRTTYLTRSIGFSLESWQAGRVRVLVFATAPYAQAVEEGTYRSRPYPFFWPAFWKYYPQLLGRVEVAVQQAFRQVEELGGRRGAP